MFPSRFCFFGAFFNLSTSSLRDLQTYAYTLLQIVYLISKRVIIYPLSYFYIHFILMDVVILLFFYVINVS